MTRPLHAFACFTLAACLVGLARGAPVQTAPTEDVVVTVQLASNVSLNVTSKPDNTTTCRVTLDQGGMFGQNVEVPMDDVAELADDVRAAAGEMRAGDKVKTRTLGAITVQQATITDPQSKETSTKIQVTGGSSGFLTTPIQINLAPDEAVAWSRGIRNAPGIWARLQACIDFDAMHK